MLKDIRKTFKTEHKSQYHPSVWLELDSEWYTHTFTKNLFKSSVSFKSFLELLNKYISKDIQELNVFFRKETCRLVKGLSDHDFGLLLIDFNKQYNSKLKTRDGVCKQIKNTSSDLDELTLGFVGKIINVDFVFFNDIDSKKSIRDTTDYDNIQDNTLFIYNFNNELYNIVGYKSQSMVNEIQSRKCLAREIDNFLDKHNFFLQMIKSIFEMKSKVTLKVLYDSIESTLGVSLLPKDRKMINKITGVLLETKVYVDGNN